MKILIFIVFLLHFGLSEQFYRVQKGDSFYKIAKKFKCSVSDILLANQLQKGQAIHPGQKLFIPDKSYLQEEALKKFQELKLGSAIRSHGGSYSSFIEKCRLLKQGKKSCIRILFLGDSHINGGFFTAEIRSVLQSALGNGGAGFISLPSQGHSQVREGLGIRSSYGWQTVMPSYSAARDIFSLAMRCHIPLRPSASVTINFKTNLVYGGEIWYRAHPGGEVLELKYNDVITNINTRSTGPRLQRFSFRTSSPLRGVKLTSLQKTVIKVDTKYKIVKGDSLYRISRKFKVPIKAICERNNISIKGVLLPGKVLYIPPARTSSGFRVKDGIEWDKAPLQILGFVFETTSGVVIDRAGINGATAARFVIPEKAAFQAQLKWRDYDLVVISFGANESFKPVIKEEEIRDSFLELARRIKAADPSLPVFLFTPPDMINLRSDKNGKNGNYDKISSIIYDVARKTESLLWDQREAMGGARSYYTWIAGGFMKKDRIHLTRTGYQRLAGLFLTELFKGQEWLNLADN